MIIIDNEVKDYGFEQGEKNMKFDVKIWLMSLSMVSAFGVEESKRLVSEENVPISFRSGKVHCRDYTPDHGFGEVLGSISIEEKELFDRTLRIQDSGGFFTHFPKTVTCADLKEELDKIPEALTVNRKLFKKISAQPIGKMRSELIGELSLEIPVKIEGKNAVLKAEQGWLLQVVAEENHVEFPRFPLESEYVTRAHPQAWAIGLKCEQFGNKFLTLGGLGSWNTSNQSEAKREFLNAEDCNEVKIELLELYRAEDPGNWGTHFRVKRELDQQYRYILSNMAKAQCQQVQVETLELDVKGFTLRAAKTFPIRTVDINHCLP